MKELNCKMYRVTTTIDDDTGHPHQFWPEPKRPPDVPPPPHQPDSGLLSTFIKTRSLREKFRDSKSWSIKRGSFQQAEITSPNTSNTSSPNQSVDNLNSSQLHLNANAHAHHQSTSSLASNASTATSSSNEHGRISRLFSIRRSFGQGMGPLDHCKSGMPRLAEEEEQMLHSTNGSSSAPNSILVSNVGTLSTKPASPRVPAPQMPPAPASLTPEQQKRRHIVASLVHSENSYVATLQRLVNDYKRPLEESSPPILSSSKVDVLFHRVPEILQCHLLFRIALSEAVRNWDKDEKIGDVFVASFSKAVVLEIYSDFINNFSLAMDCAKQESKRRSALADFLKVKQITAHDRVSFFGLMVKPVQRFPQFILLLQDLLKETPPGHPDRMALQLALTTLESLAEMLNERKREAEQFAAFREKMRNISAGGKFSGGNNRAALLTSPVAGSGSSDGGPNGHCNTPNRFLLKEDDMTQLEFNAAGLITRSKQRRLLLLNDLLLCVTVNGRSSEVDFNPVSSANNNERLSLKWAVPVGDVEIVDGAAGGTLARLLAPSASSSGSSLSAMGKRASLGRAPSTDPSSSSGSTPTPTSSSAAAAASTSSAASAQAENLAQDMADLMHDFDVVSRVASLIGTTRGRYEGLTLDVTSQILADIQSSIRQKDEEMSYMDACCLQIALKGRNSKDKPETYTFQTRDPNAKREWIVEIRLAQLALDPNNSPGWDVLEQERSISTKMPLYVKSMQVFHAPKHQAELNCGCSYSLMVQTPTRAQRVQTYLWTNATDGRSSHLRILGVASNQTAMKELGTIALEHLAVRTVQFVPGMTGGVAAGMSSRSSGVSLMEDPLKADMVWVGTNDKTIILYSASDPERGIELGRATLRSEIQTIVYHCDAVWVGTESGDVTVFRRDVVTTAWDLNNPTTINLGEEAISCLLPITTHGGGGLYAACGRRVWVIDALSNEQVKSFVVQPRTTSSDNTNNKGKSSPEIGAVHQMAQSGVGLWVALKNSCTICLYHTETFRHLQDINIASNVSRVLAAREVSQPQRSIHVTAMAASRGLLWVGTNVGIALTVPLPRLEGVPIISGRANISYHAHFGPVNFFLNLQRKVLTELASSSSAMPPLPPASSKSVSATIKEEPELDLKSNGGGGGTDSGINSLSHASVSLDETESTPSAKPPLKKQSSAEGLLSEASRQHPKLRHRNSSPLRRRSRADYHHHHTQAQVASRRASKTLPRGFSIAAAAADMHADSNDVFGLYGDLLNVRDYDCDSGELSRQGEELRKSDPELSTIPYRVSTLDRRVRMKTSRPRSLDMSSWSVESKGSAQTTSSSEAGSERPSPSVSRNASFQSTGTASVSSLSFTQPTSTSSASSASSTAGSSHSQQGQSQESQTSPTSTGTQSPPEEVEETKKSTGDSNSAKRMKKKLEAPKTVTTLMGGRGYINWRRTSVEKQRTSAHAQINNTDAFLVVWEMKL